MKSLKTFSCFVMLALLGGCKDSIKPLSLISIYPSNGEVVPYTVRWIKLNFDRIVDDQSILNSNPIVLESSGGAIPDVELALQGSSILGILGSDLSPNTSYTIRVNPSFKAQFPKFKFSLEEVVFSTSSQADVTGPSLLSSSPGNFQNDFSTIGLMELQFSEQVSSLSPGDSIAVYEAESLDRVNSSVSFNGSSVTLLPLTELLQETNYFIQVTSSLTDLSNNPAATTRIDFKTGSRGGQVSETGITTNNNPQVRMSFNADGSAERYYILNQSGTNQVIQQLRSAGSDIFTGADVVYQTSQNISLAGAMRTQNGDHVVSIITGNTGGTLVTALRPNGSATWSNRVDNYVMVYNVNVQAGREGSAYVVFSAATGSGIQLGYLYLSNNQWTNRVVRPAANVLLEQDSGIDEEGNLVILFNIAASPNTFDNGLFRARYHLGQTVSAPNELGISEDPGVNGVSYTSAGQGLEAFFINRAENSLLLVYRNNLKVIQKNLTTTSFNEVDIEATEEAGLVLAYLDNGMNIEVLNNEFLQIAHHKLATPGFSPFTAFQVTGERFALAYKARVSNGVDTASMVVVTGSTTTDYVQVDFIGENMSAILDYAYAYPIAIEGKVLSDNGQESNVFDIHILNASTEFFTAPDASFKTYLVRK